MSDFEVQEVLEYVEENDVKFIRLAFCDIFGNMKNISIMPKELEKAFDVGVVFDASRIIGCDCPDFPDLYLKPDPKTLSVLPWRPQQGRVIRFYCDVVNPDGVSYTFDTRKLLIETLRECRDMGFTPRIGLKTEFYLFKTDDEGRPTNVPWDEGGYMDISPYDKGENIRREICLCLEEMGIYPEASHHEAGPGQNEIVFRPSDALGTADNFITYKNVVSAISDRNGVFASFAPKPIKGKSGNGLHIKISTWKNGENLDDIDPEFTTCFMAGVFNRVKDITVFLNSTVESYERFGENEAPKYINWSAQSNSRLMRVPIVNGKRTCFELRSPDSGVNPYLAFAMIIQAGLAGVRGKEELPPPLDIKSSAATEDDKKKYDMLPNSLKEAVDCARKSDFLQNNKLSDIANYFLDTIVKYRL